MPWTCQPDAHSPLWWPLAHADHWYDPHTAPERLAEEYRRAHPHHRERPLVLRWWMTWGVPGFQVQVAPRPRPERRDEPECAGSTDGG